VKRVVVSSSLVTLLSLAACGGTTPPAETPKNDDGPAVQGNDSGGPSVESEIGALNEDKVKAAFHGVAGGLEKCFRKGAERVSFMGGEARLVVRVKADGSVRIAFVKESTLGDRATEDCMLSELKRASWPKPVGGREGIAESSFSFDPDGEERPPVAWTPDRLGKQLAAAHSAVAGCSGHGASITLYVDTDGKPKSVGVASKDGKAEQAASCIVDALGKITFPSPGSYPAKVTFE
jgi:hypothetical protein